MPKRVALVLRDPREFFKILRFHLRRATLVLRDPREFFKRLRSHLAENSKSNEVLGSETILYTEVTANCTNKCTFCSIDKVKRRGYIKKDVAYKVRDLISSNPERLFRVYFHMVGEPLLYSGLEEYIKLLSLPNAMLWVCTNGVLLDDARLHSLRDAGLNNIWFSMFYTKEKDYKKSTRSDNFLPVKNNLYGLLSKNELFKQIHIVTFSNNADEIMRMIKNKKNVTLEMGRMKQVWEYDPAARPNFISVSIDGEVNFNWEDYNFTTSIGNICDLPPATVIKAYEKQIAGKIKNGSI